MDDHADFELLIERVRKRHWAQVLRSPAGTGEGGPFDLFLYEPYSDKREVDPRGPGRRERGMRRGGSWESRAHVCSSGHRSIVKPYRSHEATGFRIVRESW